MQGFEQQMPDTATKRGVDPVFFAATFDIKPIQEPGRPLNEVCARRGKPEVMRIINRNN